MSGAGCWRQHRAVARSHRPGTGDGLTESELKEAIIHLAFYAGWPRAMSAITVAKDVFTQH